MITKITSAIFLFSLVACAQTGNINCKKTLNKVPYFVRHAEDKDSIQMDFDILRTCGQLDAFDGELLKGPLLGTILIQQVSKEKEITYNTILRAVKKFKESDTYPQIRETIIASKTLEEKTVTEEGFDEDRNLLLKAGLPESELNDFKKFLQSNAWKRMTYKEAFLKYDEFRKNSLPPPPERLEFTKLVDIESAIKSGEESGKKVLLYFSCYACANSRKMEDYVLIDDRVKSLISQNFVYFVAYVDDRRPDESTGLTVGKKFMQIQQDKFNNNYQPYFCIIDNSGKVLSQINYTNKAEEFIDFLNKAL